ncbi:MAG: hypothetical protein J6Z36_01330 [Clostridia bacterium]|nr:hypothetical protein [Clostridia bacterium]
MCLFSGLFQDLFGKKEREENEWEELDFMDVNADGKTDMMDAIITDEILFGDEDENDFL